MAYKNTETNPSAQGAFYQWNYFSQALGKIGASKGATPNIVAKDVQPEKEVDWMKVASTATLTANQAYEAFQEYSYKEAEEYLKTHSIEEYSKDMDKGNIPFQMNPIAFSRLKYLHGKMAFAVAEEQFKINIQNKKYLNMSPEELDAEHFKFMQNAQEELRDTFPYVTEEDGYFNKGFWETSPENRLKAIGDQQQVDNQWHIKEASVQDDTEISSIVGNPNSTAEDIVESIDYIFSDKNPNYIYYDADTRRKKIDMVLGLISGRADGVKILDSIADKDLKIIPGEHPLKDVVGEVEWFKYKRESQNVNYINDVKRWVKDHEDAEKHIQTGDTLYFKNRIEDATARSGGSVNDEVKFWVSGLGQAETQKKRLLVSAEQKAQNDAKEGEEVQLCIKRLNDLKAQRDVPTLGVLDIKDKTQEKVWFASRRLPEDNPNHISEEDAVLIALNPSYIDDNPAQKEFSIRGSMVVASMRSHVDMVRRSSSAKVEPPPELEKLASLYTSDKLARPDYSFGIIFKNMRPEDRDDIITYALLKKSEANPFGFDYQEIIEARASFGEKLDTKEGRADLMSIDQTIRHKLTGKHALDRYGYTLAYRRALSYVQNGMGWNTAVTNAIRDVKNENLTVDKTTVPSTLFRVDKALPENVMKTCMEGMLEDANSKRGKGNKLTRKDVHYEYNPISGSFDMIEVGTRDPLGSITEAEAKEYYNKYLDRKASLL